MHDPAAGRDGSLRLYVRLDATVNGNGGGGTAQRRRRRRRPSTRPPARSVSSRHQHRRPRRPTATTPCRRSWRCAPTGRSLAASSGYAGTAVRRADPARRRPRARRRRTPTAPTATSCRPPSCDSATATPDHPRARLRRAPAAARSAPPAPRARRASTALDALPADWTAYDARLTRLPTRWPAWPPRRRAARPRTSCRPTSSRPARTRRSRARSRPSLASPWGQAVSAGDLPERQAGLLRLLPRGVRPRPVRGVHRAARRRRHRRPRGTATRFLFERQQLADGRMPRNSLLNGKAPRTPAATSSTRRRTRS